MQRSEAEEHLRVIRSLMEKATLYRAISAPTALLGGVLCLVVGGLLAGPWWERAEAPDWFFWPWFLVFLVTAAANAKFIYQEARRRGERFISPGMKMAFKALAPSHAVAGFASVLALAGPLGWYPHWHYDGLPAVWCVCYGLGLLATEHFAPRSLVWLGWSFLFAGLMAGTVYYMVAGNAMRLPGEATVAQLSNATMALTFGLLHLVYAACAWPRVGRAREGTFA